MKITVNTTYEVTFSVQYFEREEGGMRTDSFGKDTKTVEDAIIQLELAELAQPERDWVIVADVSKTINGKPQ